MEIQEAIEKIVEEYEKEYPDPNYVEYPELYELYLSAKRVLDGYMFD